MFNVGFTFSPQSPGKLLEMAKQCDTSDAYAGNSSPCAMEHIALLSHANHHQRASAKSTLWNSEKKVLNGLKGLKGLRWSWTEPRTDSCQDAV